MTKASKAVKTTRRRGATAANPAKRPSRAVMASTDDNTIQRWIMFVQYDEPALKVDEYKLTVTQTTNTDAPNRYTTSRDFAVSGERFSFQSGEIDSVYPPDLANGEFDGSLSSVVLNRRTLPWDRYLDTSNPELPWLAVLVFNADQQPVTRAGTAADLSDTLLVILQFKQVSSPGNDCQHGLEIIIIQAVDCAKTGAEGSRHQCQAGCSPDHGKARQLKPDGARGWSLANHYVQGKIFHCRVEHFLNGPSQAVDLVNK